jgi:hypothetical protein
MRRIRRDRRVARALALAALALAAAVCSSCEKTTTETVLVPTPYCQSYSWRFVWPPLTANAYNAVYGLDESNVIAVGDFGGVARYNGAAWAWSSAGVSRGLHDVWIASPTDAFAVGDAGVFRYDGSAWRPLFNTGNDYYQCVWGSGPDDVWCGTTTDYLSHWNGTSWSTVILGSYNYFYDMWGTASNDIYAVGQSGNTGLATVWHYDGATWSDVTPPGVTNYSFNSVWGTASNNVYVAGDGGTIRRWNGSSWSGMTTTGLPAGTHWNAIRGRSASDIYLAMSGYVYHFNGSSWTDTGLLDDFGGTYHYLRDLWAGPSKLYAVGDAGAVITYDGSSWTSENGSFRGALLDVWSSGPTEAFAVGSSGAILRYDGTAVTNMSLPGVTNSLYGVSGSPGNVYAVGSNGTVLRFDGSAWADIGAQAATEYTTLQDVWVSGATAVAVGYGGRIYKITGTNVEPMTSGTSETLRGVWGSSLTDVFAVGEDGTILHCDGTNWTAMDPGGIEDDFKHVGGSASNDVYALGEKGFLVHYDGSSWKRVYSPMGANTGTMGVLGPKDLFVVDYSAIYRYDGANWTGFPPLCWAPLYGLAGSGPSSAFAVGYNGVILRYGE